MSIDSPEDKFGKASALMDRLASTRVVMRSRLASTQNRLANDRPTLVHDGLFETSTGGGGTAGSRGANEFGDEPFHRNPFTTENTQTNEPNATMQEVVNDEGASRAPVVSEPARRQETSRDSIVDEEDEKEWYQKFAEYVDLIWEKTRDNAALGVLAMGLSGLGTYIGLDLLNANPQIALAVGASSMLSSIAIGFIENNRLALRLERKIIYSNANKWMRKFARSRTLSNLNSTLTSVLYHPITMGAMVGATTYGAIHLRDNIQPISDNQGTVHGREVPRPEQLPESHTSPVQPPGPDVTPEPIKIDPANEPFSVDLTPPFVTGPGTEIPWNHELEFVQNIGGIQNEMATTNLLKNIWHGIEQTGTDWTYLNRLDAKEAAMRLEGILRMATQNPSFIDSLNGTDSLLYQLGSVGRPATPEEVQQIIQTFPMP
jgi:hypothetical protein